MANYGKKSRSRSRSRGRSSKSPIIAKVDPYVLKDVGIRYFNKKGDLMGKKTTTGKWKMLEKHVIDKRKGYMPTCDGNGNIRETPLFKK